MQEQTNEAFRAFQEGRITDAEALANAVTAAGVNDPELFNLHGVLLHRLGRQVEAAAKFDRAVQLRLNFPVAHANLCTVLAELRDPTPRFPVSVITPTIGSSCLAQAIQGVQSQTYPLLEHIIVADGPEYHRRVRNSLPADVKHPIQVFELPQNTGRDGFNGHRVYGALPYLLSSRFVAFLDEDNWFEPEHIASLMARITAEGLCWAYSLRKLVDLDGRWIANDDCESLGHWPTWNNPSEHLVDVNCYLMRRDLAIATSPLWYRRFRDEKSPDFAICQQLLRDHPRCGTNGQYTVNYRVGGSDTSVQPEFFLFGNAAVRQQFPSGFPWREVERR